MKTKSLDLSNTYVTKVQRIDPSGQGICMIEGNTIFIPKALPNELIKIKLLEKKKGIYLGKLLEILEPAKERNLSECTHFDVCSGCNYLHVNYPQELIYKEKSLSHALSYLNSKDIKIQVIGTKKRFEYRNRVQMHYQLSPVPKLGFVDRNATSLSVLPINDCLLPLVEIRQFYQEFKKVWLNHVPAHAPQNGHVEIYFQQNTIHLAWNENYSHLGFTQVNDEGNQLLKAALAPYFKHTRTVLELFCGDGNLLKPFQHFLKVYGFDAQGSLPKPHHFTAANLYLPEGINQATQLCKKIQFQDLVLDPPRSGFSQLSDVVSQSSFERLFYISCWPSTMVRDLNNVFQIRPWKKIDIYLIDMFPGTKHYETIAIISW